MSPMKRNSVCEESRVRRLKSSRKRSAVECHGDVLCPNVHLKDERYRKVVYHRHTDGDLEKQMRLEKVAINNVLP